MKEEKENREGKREKYGEFLWPFIILVLIEQSVFSQLKHFENRTYGQRR